MKKLELETVLDIIKAHTINQTKQKEGWRELLAEEIIQRLDNEDVTMKKKLKFTLKIKWQERAKLRAEGAKLRAEGAKLLAERAKLLAEGAKLWAEGAKLLAEGDKLWACAIIEIKGNIKIEWEYVSEKSDYRCKLETGEVFEPVLGRS